ncbi:MAG TPA: mycofactocin-coupled SDR family oxidoreductase [Acidimicrobiales bacterium]|nr:mycofactocin-coupled SDR family oxidoreductase [Acidimicrobiales bacterium]
MGANDGRLAGRTAWVTGAARGQGRAHALALAAEGADVVVSDIGTGRVPTLQYALPDPAELDETVRLVRELGRRCVGVPADVRDSEQVDRAVATAVDELGHLDVVVANAGICGFGDFWEITDEMWDDMIAVDLTGAFKTMRAAAPHMIDRGYGRIVVVSSMAGRRGSPHLAHYSAAKWGVIGLVKTLALEVARHGVTVNAVCPATVDTPMVHNDAFYGLFAPDIANPTREQVEPRYARLNPLPVPWMDPSDVSQAVVFLASDEARYVSGTTMEVSCGSSATMT